MACKTAHNKVIQSEVRGYINFKMDKGHLIFVEASLISTEIFFFSRNETYLGFPMISHMFYFHRNIRLTSLNFAETNEKKIKTLKIQYCCFVETSFS